MLATGANGLRPLRTATDEHCSTQRHPGRSNLYFASYGEGPVRVGSSISHGVERWFAGSSRGKTRGKHRARNQLKVEERELHAPYHAIASSRRRLATLTTGGDCHASSDSRYFDFGVGYELVWCCVRARSWRRRWGRHCWWSGSRPRWNRDEYSQQ